MKVDLIHYTPLEIAVEAIRTCHDTLDKSDNLGEKDKELIRKIVSMGHLSTLEHLTYTFRIQGISRVCSHQLVRHRIASYSQQSHRYTSPKDFVIPPKIASRVNVDDYTRENLYHYVWDFYEALIDAGIPREDARYFLPQAVTTSLIMTINARSLRNFFQLRLDKKAQWEIRLLAENMYLKLPLDHRLTVFYDIDLQGE